MLKFLRRKTGPKNGVQKQKKDKAKREEKRNGETALSCGFCRKVRRKVKPVANQDKKPNECDEEIKDGEERKNEGAEKKKDHAEKGSTDSLLHPKSEKVEDSEILEVKDGIDALEVNDDSERELEDADRTKELKNSCKRSDSETLTDAERTQALKDSVKRLSQSGIVPADEDFTERFLDAEFVMNNTHVELMKRRYYDWRRRAELSNVGMKLCHRLSPSQVSDYIAPLSKLLVIDPVAEVRSKGLELLAEIVAMFAFSDAPSSSLLNESRRSFLQSDSYRRRQSWGKFMQIILKKKLMNTKQFMLFFEDDLIAISQDKVVFVRLTTCQIALCAEVNHLVKYNKVIERISSLAHGDNDSEIRLQAGIVLRIINTDYKELRNHQKTDEKSAVARSGWWNVTMNLENIIAVTHNSLSNFQMWPKIVEYRPNLPTHWLRTLSASRPETVPIIKETNRKTNRTIEDSPRRLLISSDSSNSDDETQSNLAVNGNRKKMPTKRSEHDGELNTHCSDKEGQKTSAS
uniref:Uncharacterized protein n=1 Tax=Acrobeloides nanus TaxID=290746 RepID=A0A914CDJ6_9BILA